METLNKISSRVTDLTKKHKCVRLDSDDTPTSFVPPTFDIHSNYTAVSSHDSSSSSSSQAPKENGGTKNLIPNSIRRFSPFPRKQSSSGGENKEMNNMKVDSSKTSKDPKDTKYRKMDKGVDNDSSQNEKNNGVWRLKDSAMGKVDRMKKGRQGQYGIQLLDSDQE